MENERQEQSEDARVILARDVLAQMEAHEIRATYGEYVSLPPTSMMDWITNGPDQEPLDLRELLRKDPRACKVCARGALFIAKVKRFNAVTTQDVPTPHSWRAMSRYLGEFSREQLALMEMAFEGNDIHDELDGEQHSAIAAWRIEQLMPLISEDEESILLKAIMQNVIANRGEFVP